MRSKSDRRKNSGTILYRNQTGWSRWSLSHPGNVTSHCVCTSGSSRASLLGQNVDATSPTQRDSLMQQQHLDSDSASESNGERPHPVSGRHRTKESDILSDEDDGFSECPARRGFTPGAIETRFQELLLSDETRLEPEGEEVDSLERPRPLRRAHFCPVKRRSVRGDGGARSSQGALLSLRQQSNSLDSQSESVLCSVDLNSLLEREFSIQSLTSVVNEDCFFENGTKAGATATSS